MKIWRVEVTRVTKYTGVIITDDDERPFFNSRAELGQFIDDDKSVRMISQFTEIDSLTELVDRAE